MILIGIGARHRRSRWRRKFVVQIVALVAQAQRSRAIALVRKSCA